MPPPRILVVDDNPELLTLLASAFEEAGYLVSKALRGRSAIDLARREKPELAVVDVLLPDLMGFDVAEMLTRLKIPFIFMSGVHKGGTVAATMTARHGALGYFEKPFERKALLELVAKTVPPPQRAPPQEPAVAATRLRVAETMPPPPGNREPISAPIPAASIPEEQLQDLPVQRPTVQRGDLRDNLAQLFAAFYSAKETGELGLQKGQVKKVVYFEGGMPVFALSNLVSDRLGPFLVRAGKIDEESLKRAAAAASSAKRRTGDMLIELGLLTEAERLYYVGQQIKSILYGLFAWEEGVFQLSFHAVARKEAIKLDIHPANLVLRAVRKLYKPDRLERLLADDQKLIPSRELLFNLSDVELQAWEAHLLTKANGMRTCRELVLLSGKPPAEARGLLVALHALRILDIV